MWRLKHDGGWYGPKWRRHTDAWMHLCRSQPQSTYYALTFGGWDIKRCSPLIRYGMRRGSVDMGEPKPPSQCQFVRPNGRLCGQPAFGRQATWCPLHINKEDRHGRER
jgi:hypothetical protein